MRILVSGSRDFTNSVSFIKAMTDVISEVQYKNVVHTKDVELVHGGARGTDMMADMFARSNNIKFKVFPADWKRVGDTYDKSAGMKRNIQMLEYIILEPLHYLIAFNMNNSKGTSGMAKACEKSKIPSYLFSTEDGEKLILNTFNVESVLGEKYK